MEQDYSVAQLASRMGVSTDTVRRAIARGELNAYRAGTKSIRIAHDEATRYIARRTRLYRRQLDTHAAGRAGDDA